MPNIGPTELIIVLVIVLVIFGPKKLPGLGRSLGTGMREFKDSITGKDDDKSISAADDDDDDEQPDARSEARRRDQPPARLIRAPSTRLTHGTRAAADRSRGSPDARRSPRRAAPAARHVDPHARGCAFSFCFWQNDAVLKIVTDPVTKTQNLQNPPHGLARTRSSARRSPSASRSRRWRRSRRRCRRRARRSGRCAARTTSRELSGASSTGRATALATAARRPVRRREALSGDNTRKLVTLGVAEPFTATITIAFYAALLLAMPFLLYQLYAFILPAFSPKERKVALPLMLMVPVLFVAGVMFGYFVVLERAIEFLQNFNDDSFDILLQAKDYFKFAVFFLAGIGLLFQIPVGVLAVTRLGIFTPKQLAKNRGYVILGIAVVAAVATPTPDPVTMTLAMAPLIVLFELSILLARWIDRIKPPPR